MQILEKEYSRPKKQVQRPRGGKYLEYFRVTRTRKAGNKGRYASFILSEGQSPRIGMT